MLRSPIRTNAAALLSICTRRDGPIRRSAPTFKRLATGCMKCSNDGPCSATRASKISRSGTRAKRARAKSMRWVSWCKILLSWGRTACGLPWSRSASISPRRPVEGSWPLNRKLYGIEKKPPPAPRPKLEMPFKARFRQEIWSVDVRYIEEHNLGFPEPIYLISVLENYSRALLASKISRTQNQWDYLEVLLAALSTCGAPSAIVSDGGGIFYCNQAMDVYASLSIRKERIEPRQAWQNLIEAHFNIARRMADARFARARSWEEILAVYQRFVHDYNVQRHCAHENRDDGCHSPAEVLGGQTSTMYPPSVLDRILFATRYTRLLDRDGYLRFQNWKLYAERGPSKAPVTIWIYEGSR